MYRRSLILPVGGGLLAWFLGAAAAAGDWPQWRGPNRDGSIPAAAVPVAWPKQLQQQWRVEVGEGHASPVVSGPRVFLLSRQGEDEVVGALALEDGKPLWSHKYPAPYEPSPYAAAHGKGPRADSRGGRPAAGHGRGGQYRVVLGHARRQAPLATRLRQGLQAGLLALLRNVRLAADPRLPGHRLCGRLGRRGPHGPGPRNRPHRWAWKGDGPGYASPILATLDGVPQLVLQSQRASIGIGPADGKLLWSMPFETRYDQNIITPVVVGDLVVLAGLSNPTAAYRFQHSGGRWTPKEVWRNEAISLWMTSPVAVGKLLFGLANRNKGQIFCLTLLQARRCGPAKAGWARMPPCWRPAGPCWP